MLNLNVGDKIQTTGLFPVVGVIHSFGYIPLDINQKAFIITDKFGTNQLLAVDLVWNEIQKL